CELAVAEAACTGGELRERPGLDVALEGSQRAGGGGDVERRSVRRDRDRRRAVEAGHSGALAVVPAQAARSAGELRQAPGRPASGGADQGVGRAAGDIREAPVRRERERIGAAQREAAGAACGGRGGDAAGGA